MDPLTASLIAVACLAAGALAGWFAHMARATTTSARAHAALQARVAVAENEAVGLREQLDVRVDEYRDLIERVRADQAVQHERERREAAVLTALSPVKESLASMQQKVTDLERDRHAQFGSLAEQLRRAHETDELLRVTTESLAGALRSNTTRGVWGETQLRRVVEAAGLTKYVDFDTQASIHSDAGAGRPDMVIRMPGGKAIAVDAKVPLDAYLEASAIPFTAVGDEAARRKDLLQKHVRAVRAHVDALAKKAYWAGLESSPEFVVCFLPSESLLAAALEEDPSLLDHAFGKRVALASPVNLWAVLKTVAYTWTQQDVTDEARTLFDLGNQLYERLGGLAQHADSLRRAIERTVDSYNGFVGSLESRVLVTARRFPGIDQTKLDATPVPAVITATPRRVAAVELRDALDGLDGDLTEEPVMTADVGAIRSRVDDTERSGE